MENLNPEIQEILNELQSAVNELGDLNIKAWEAKKITSAFALIDSAARKIKVLEINSEE